MNVFTVVGDDLRYRSVERMDGEDFLPHGAHGRFGFSTVPCRIRNSTLPTSHFMHFLSHAFAFDEQAVIDLAPDGQLLSTLEMAGPYGRLDVEGSDRIFAIDVQEVCNALDTGATVWKKGQEENYFGIERFAFHRDRIGSFSGLFTLPVNHPCPVFAFSGEAGHGKGFMDLYLETGATGLSFRKVWSDEN